MCALRFSLLTMSLIRTEALSFHVTSAWQEFVFNKKPFSIEARETGLNSRIALMQSIAEGAIRDMSYQETVELVNERIKLISVYSLDRYSREFCDYLYFCFTDKSDRLDRDKFLGYVHQCYVARIREWLPFKNGSLQVAQALASDIISFIKGANDCVIFHIVPHVATSPTDYLSEITQLKEYFANDEGASTDDLQSNLSTIDFSVLSSGIAHSIKSFVFNQRPFASPVGTIGHDSEIILIPGLVQCIILGNSLEKTIIVIDQKLQEVDYHNRSSLSENGKSYLEYLYRSMRGESISHDRMFDLIRSSYSNFLQKHLLYDKNGICNKMFTENILSYIKGEVDSYLLHTSIVGRFNRIEDEIKHLRDVFYPQGNWPSELPGL